MSSGPPSAPKLEIAHVLFMDIVAYSRLPMDQQRRTLATLQELVSATEEFQQAAARNELIRLPTGDGMALVFFGDPETPVRCALEVSAALRTHPEIRLRIGVNTGPVYRVDDINANRNVAGGGINMAQRVMDCGDAGHILLSKSTADVIGELSSWSGHLHDLGEAEVKHGVRIHVFNFHTDAIGNRTTPSKLRAAVARRRKRGAAWVAGILAALAAFFTIWYFASGRGRIQTGIKERPSVTVIKLRNLNGRTEAEWLGKALPEYLRSALGADAQLRIVSAEEMSQKLGPEVMNSDSLSGALLTRIHSTLHCDFIVTGSYTDIAGDALHLDLRLLNALTGEVMATAGIDGTETAVFDLVRRTSTQLRTSLGVRDLNPTELAGLQASLPSKPAARKLYPEGLDRLRVFDALGARDKLTQAVAIEPDFPLAHSALAQALSELGYDKRAAEEAKQAAEHSSNLSPQERDLVLARDQELNQHWEAAIDAYRRLWIKYPDELDFGLRLASVQTSAGRAKEALLTLAEMRNQNPKAAADPRLDLKEAEAAENLGDLQAEYKAAVRAADGARAIGSPLLIAAANIRQCWSLLNLGDSRNAIARCEESKAINDQLGNLSGSAVAVNNIANALNKQGDFAGARKRYEEAVQITRSIGDQGNMSGALNQLANMLVLQGDARGAQKVYEQSLAVAGERDDRGLKCTLLINLATTLRQFGDLPAAQSRYEEGLSLARALEDKQSIALALNNLGILNFLRGDLAGADSHYQESLKLRREIGEKEKAAAVLDGLGDLLVARDDLPGAQKQYEEALRIQNEIDDKNGAAYSSLGVAQVWLEQGSLPQAESGAGNVASTLQSQGDPDGEVLARCTLVRSLLQQKKIPEAQKESARITELTAKTQDETVRLTSAITLARLWNALGRPQEARKTLDRALAESLHFGFVPWQLEASLALGEVAWKQGNTGAGRNQIEMTAKEAEAKGFTLLARRAQTSPPR